MRTPLPIRRKISFPSLAGFAAHFRFTYQSLACLDAGGLSERMIVFGRSSLERALTQYVATTMGSGTTKD